MIIICDDYHQKKNGKAKNLTLEPESRYVALDLVDIVFSDALVLRLALLLKFCINFSPDGSDDVEKPL